MPSRKVAFLPITLMLALFAQAQSGSLQGTITDPSGSVVPGASISVLDGDGKDVVKITKSDGQGHYQVVGIPPGLYTIRALFPRFQTFEVKNYGIGEGRPQTLDIALELRGELEKVTVAGDAGARVETDPGANAGAVVLQKADMEALADDPDDLAADLQALAGPAAGPNGGQIFIDGFTGGRLPPKSAIREVRINQNPFAAQFDRPGQGRIEIFTKPGTDEFHGQLTFQFSDAAFNARNPFVTTKPPFQRRQWEGELGGPLGKKTSFFFDFERRDINENAFVSAFILDSNLNVVPFSQAIVTPISNVEMNFKLDRTLNANNTLTLRYTYAHDENDNQGVGGFTLADRAYNTHGAEDTIQASETAVLSTRTINEVRFRLRMQRNDNSGGTNAPAINVLDAFASGGSPVGNSYNHQDRYEMQDFVSHVRGTHAFRVGGIVRAVNESDDAEQNYAGTFTFTSLAAYRAALQGTATPSQFTLRAGNPLAGINQFDVGLFAQDDWRIRPRFTLSGGLRYETQSHVRGSGVVAPRLGIAWGLGKAKNGSPSNVIRAGAGIFYDRISESLTLDALHQNGIAQQLFSIPNPTFFPTIPSAQTLASGRQPQTIREVDHQWQAPTMVQVVASFEHQIAKGVTTSSSYTYSQGSHVLRSRDINAPLPVSGVYPFGTQNGIYLYESSGVFRQEQWITNLTLRPNSKLTLTTFYVLGFAHSNADGAGSFPANQYDLSTEYGRAGFDVRHRFQLNGSYTGKWGLRVSPFVTLASGRPYDITTGTDSTGQGLYTDRPAFATDLSRPSVVRTSLGVFDVAPGPGQRIIQRNFAQGPGLIAANLRLAKIFTIGESSPKGGKDPKQIILQFNARNALNHPNFSTPDGNLTSPLFAQSNGLVSGQGSTGTRRIDVQLRFLF